MGPGLARVIRGTDPWPGEARREVLGVVRAADRRPLSARGAYAARV